MGQSMKLRLLQACLEHRHSFVRRNAVLAINALYKLPKGELLLQDAPELIEKVLQVSAGPVMEQPNVTAASADEEGGIAGEAIGQAGLDVAMLWAGCSTPHVGSWRLPCCRTVTGVRAGAAVQQDTMLS
jgi:hypothetical protein